MNKDHIIESFEKNYTYKPNVLDGLNLEAQSMVVKESWRLSMQEHLINALQGDASIEAINELASIQLALMEVLDRTPTKENVVSYPEGDLIHPSDALIAEVKSHYPDNLHDHVILNEIAMAMQVSSGLHEYSESDDAADAEQPAHEDDDLNSNYKHDQGYEERALIRPLSMSISTTYLDNLGSSANNAAYIGAISGALDRESIKAYREASMYIDMAKTYSRMSESPVEEIKTASDLLNSFVKRMQKGGLDKNLAHQIGVNIENHLLGAMNNIRSPNKVINTESLTTGRSIVDVARDSLNKKRLTP